MLILIVQYSLFIGASFRYEDLYLVEPFSTFRGTIISRAYSILRGGMTSALNRIRKKSPAKLEIRDSRIIRARY